VKGLPSKSIEHVSIEIEENTKAEEEDLGNPPRVSSPRVSSPRVSPLRVLSPTATSPPQIPRWRMPEIDPVQQEIYDYIESLEKMDAART